MEDNSSSQLPLASLILIRRSYSMMQLLTSGRPLLRRCKTDVRRCLILRFKKKILNCELSNCLPLSVMNIFVIANLYTIDFHMNDQSLGFEIVVRSSTLTYFISILLLSWQISIVLLSKEKAREYQFPNARKELNNGWMLAFIVSMYDIV